MTTRKRPPVAGDDAAPDLGRRGEDPRRDGPPPTPAPPAGDTP